MPRGKPSTLSNRQVTRSLRLATRVPYAASRMRSKVGIYLQNARERLAELLGGEAWRQEDLATLLDVKLHTIRKWEQGQRVPSQSDLTHLERCLILAERGIDPRTIHGPQVEDLSEEAAEAVSRGYPKGRPRKPD